MPGGGYSVTITAVDAATATIDRVNKRIEDMQRPFKRVHASLENMQRSFAKFGDLTGITKIVTGFRGIARFALSSFQAIGRIVAPLGAITGAASVAGLYRLVQGWAEFTQHLGFSAQRMGLNVEQLQGLQGAAKLAGVDAGALTSGLTTLNDTLTDAVGGRAPQAVTMFQTLGVQFRDAQGNARKAADVLPELADKIAAIKNPSLQARAAVALFGGAAENLLPFLRLGSQGIEEYTRLARSYGVVNTQAVDAANEFQRAQAQASLAVEGLGNSIAVKLAPGMSQMLGWLADLIGRNREVIATWVGEKVDELGKFLKGVDWQQLGKTLLGVLDTANSVAKAFGGWQTVLEGIAIYMAGAWALRIATPLMAILKLATSLPGAGSLAGIIPGLLASPVAPIAAAAAVMWPSTTNKGEDEWVKQHGNAGVQANINKLTPVQLQRAHQLFDIARKNGISENMAYGMVANAFKESAFTPDAVGDGGAAQGIAQWHGDRQQLFRAWYGKDIAQASFAEQAEFMAREAKQDPRFNEMNAVTSTYQGGALVSKYYERPLKTNEEMATRGGYAQQFEQIGANGWAQNGVLAGPPQGPVVPSGPAVATPTDAPQAQPGPNGKAELVVRLPNLPQGSQTQLTTQGDIWSNTRVDRPMLGAGGPNS